MMAGQFGPNRTSAASTAVTGAGSASVGTSSASAVAANENRIELFLANDHATQVIYLGLGVTAVLNKGIRLDPGQGIVISSFAGAIYAIATGASTTLTIAEV